MGTYTIVILSSGGDAGDGEDVVVGEAHVEVREGETTTVRITLDKGANISG